MNTPIFLSFIHIAQVTIYLLAFCFSQILASYNGNINLSNTEGANIQGRTSVLNAFHYQ